MIYAMKLVNSDRMTYFFDVWISLKFVPRSKQAVWSHRPENAVCGDICAGHITTLSGQTAEHVNVKQVVCVINHWI